MAFHDVEVPSGFQYGSAAGVSFATTVQETASGHEFRIARQAQGRHRFRLLKQLLTTTEVMTLKTFQLARRGVLHSFKLTDFADNTTASDGTTAPASNDQTLGTGDGVETTFQLVKRYDVLGANEYTRVLTLPVSGSVVVAVNGTPTAAFTVNGLGQIVLATAAPNGHIVTAGCRFYVPVRFERDLLTLQADAFGVWQVPDFDCVEVLNEVEWPERWYAGGSKDWGSISSSVQLAFQDGVLQRFSPTTAVSAFLPAPNRLPGGPRIFRLAVASGALGSLQVRDDEGNAVGTALVADDIKDVSLAVNDAESIWMIR